MIATKLATGTESLDDYVKKTLLYHTTSIEDTEKLVSETIADLKEMQLIEVKNDVYKATLLGEAVVASSLTPEDGLFVYKQLKKSLEAFVLDCDMHAL